MALKSTGVLLHWRLEYFNFPFKDFNTTTLTEQNNVTSNVQCASLCTKDFSKCKAFNFNLKNYTCQLINFAFPNSSSSQSMFGYVDYGLFFNRCLLKQAQIFTMGWGRGHSGQNALNFCKKIYGGK